MLDEMLFRDRTDAGRALAEKLAHLRDDDVVVVGLPRGGVPVASEVARALDAPLDVIVVRKLGVPFQPEWGMGAIGEGGVRVVDSDIVHRARVPLAGRVVVVDDGLATSSTARAACEVARAAGAARVVVAVPVAPPGWLRARPEVAHLPAGFFGASTGAAAALWAAAADHSIGAVVSRGGRPDLAGARLGWVTAPTLLVVGGRDRAVLDLNRRAQAQLRCDNRLAVVPRATHLFEEPGTLQVAAELARDWFVDHLGRALPL
jgi:adenine/guanine phosphoribosyltransferase-like PRPP-binding protein